MVSGLMIIGPSGSGKSTLCDYLSQFYSQIDREVRIINLDPGNDQLPYKAYLDITELITVNDVKQEFNLG